MFFEGIQKEIQKRYPMIHLRFNAENQMCEVWENHGTRINNGWRMLWVYENHDGSRFPVLYDRVIEWLIKADTRNWYGEQRDLFHEIVNGKETRNRADKQDFRNKMAARMGEDHNYIKGIKTFFMDPRSMPQRESRGAPEVDAILRKWGAV